MFFFSDLMLPGVVVSKYGLPSVQRDQVVAVNVTDNQTALAVGQALMSAKEMVEVAGNWNIYVSRNPIYHVISLQQ